VIAMATLDLSAMQHQLRAEVAVAGHAGCVAAGGFAGGALLALPVLLVAVLIRRVARARRRREDLR